MSNKYLEKIAEGLGSDIAAGAAAAGAAGAAHKAYGNRQYALGKAEQAKSKANTKANKPKMHTEVARRQVEQSKRTGQHKNVVKTLKKARDATDTKGVDRAKRESKKWTQTANSKKILTGAGKAAAKAGAVGAVGGLIYNQLNKD